MSSLGDAGDSSGSEGRSSKDVYQRCRRRRPDPDLTRRVDRQERVRPDREAVPDLEEVVVIPAGEMRTLMYYVS